MTGHETDSAARMPSVLVLEDDTVMLRSILRLLSESGYRVHGAQDGRQGLRILDEEVVDVVVSDILMPDMDGIEIIRAVRRRSPDIPVIAMSGGGMVSKDVLLDSARTLGAVASISKPFTRAELLEGLRRVLAAPEPKP